MLPGRSGLVERPHRRNRWSERLIKCAAHDRYLLLLRSDDLLGKTAQRLAAAVAQLLIGHVNGALVMRHHHGHEVSIHVVGWLDLHRDHHPSHPRITSGDEGRIIWTPSRTRGALATE